MRTALNKRVRYLQLPVSIFFLFSVFSILYSSVHKVANSFGGNCTGAWARRPQATRCSGREDGEGLAVSSTPCLRSRDAAHRTLNGRQAFCSVKVNQFCERFFLLLSTPSHQSMKFKDSFIQTSHKKAASVLTAIILNPRYEQRSS